MKSNMTLALAANTWANRFNPGAVAAARMRYLPMSDGEVLVASEAVLQEAREVYAEQSAALAKLRAMAEPVVDIQEDDSLPQRITAAMDDADADEQEKRDRLIIRPERGDVSGEDAAVRKVEEERADWDRQHDGDRFE